MKLGGSLGHGYTAPPLKARRTSKKHHSIRPLQPTIEPREPAFTVVEEEAAKLEIYDPIIDSLALTAFRNAVEEYMLRFLSIVRLSMHAARRTYPIAPDFERAIASLDVPDLSDQLRAYQIGTPDSNQPLLPTPPPDDVFHTSAVLPPSLLGPELESQDGLQKFHRNPKFLPPLPPSHTYKKTPFVPPRENDSRRIRELATEEGKLGEQALRKLAGAVKLDMTHPVDHETHKQALSSAGAAVGPFRNNRRRRKSLNEAAIFEETMRSYLKAEPDGFELGPIVTAEKGVKMPDDGLPSKARRSGSDSAADKAQDVGGSSSRRSTDTRMAGVEVMEL
ncbi:uncharacterized protein AB675_8299 [Cyphellophora attinorum]|uniref:Transcription initiation factor TFIID subunit 8 n=1 Tax=Cyphellophora attinorum TaxID=1664694 RepID=A0A0N1P3T5_9EURO|nr:uncharacterized protein AB675_8299 [Phialophora attinorum]KPI44607.1 hypothetical protein AB675_8299 [Phialophora attinorum]